MKLRQIQIDTLREPIVYLRHDSEFCRAQGALALTKVNVHADGKSLIGVLNIVGEDFLQVHEVGLSEFAFEKLGLPADADVDVHHLEPVRSVELIR